MVTCTPAVWSKRVEEVPLYLAGSVVRRSGPVRAERCLVPPPNTY